jgi:hypothetical protein
MIDVTNPTRHDLERIAGLVGYEVATLNHYHETFEEFRSKVLLGAEQHALRLGHFFFTAMYAWYTNSQFVSLRAVTDPNKTQLNLGTLLKMIERADPAILGEVPRPGAVRRLIDDLKAARAQLHRYVSQRIAHRDVNILEGPDYNDANALLARVDGMTGAAWGWVFGPNRPRIFVDRDPYWAELLFGQKWLPPTEFYERLAASREIAYATEEERRDFTPTEVWAQRLTDETLAKIGMTREQFERYRAGDDTP